MGQAESAGEGGETEVDLQPAMNGSRRRQDYLNNLGIQKDKRQNYRPLPAAAVEAPELHTAPKDQASFGGEAAPVDQEEPYQMDFLDMKTVDEGRLDFLRKLSYHKVWVPQAQRPPKHQTVIIFDWDDTLLCTSFLNLRQDQGLSPVVERHLRGIEDAGIKLLEIAARTGKTFIITNAMSGWVELSAATWMPRILPVLQKVTVISARSRYESQFPQEVGQWKIHAFLEVQQQLDSEIITNLVSLGDSNFEMDAVHVMGKEFSQALVKTIKFQGNPSPEELLKQLGLVSQRFEQILGNPRNLKIGLERKRASAAGAAPAPATGAPPRA